MANSLNMDLTNCLIVLGREYYPSDEAQWDDEQNRTVFVTGGFGSSSSAGGSALYVRGNDGKVFRAEGHMVQKFIRRVPEDETGIAYVVTVMSPSGVETHEVVANSPTAANYKVMDELGWLQLPHRADESHDDILVQVDGAEIVLSPKMKR